MEFALRASSSTSTARYVAAAISPDPAKPIAFTVRYANYGNTAFWSAAVKQAANPKPPGATQETLEQLAREEDAVLYAATVLTGWENVTMTDGTPVPFSGSDAEKLLLQWVRARQSGENDVDYGARIDAWNAFRSFCRRADSFRVAAAAADDLGKG